MKEQKEVVQKIEETAKMQEGKKLNESISESQKKVNMESQSEI